jgi:hypothetical protein
MPQSRRSLCWILALAIAVAGCRPGDAPKEPTEPTEPTVGVVLPDEVQGGLPIALARRSQALSKLL